MVNWSEWCAFITLLWTIFPLDNKVSTFHNATTLLFHNEFCCKAVFNCLEFLRALHKQQLEEFTSNFTPICKINRSGFIHPFKTINWKKSIWKNYTKQRVLDKWVIWCHEVSAGLVYWVYPAKTHDFSLSSLNKIVSESRVPRYVWVLKIWVHDGPEVNITSRGKDIYNLWCI